MLGRIRDIIEYISRSNQYSKRELVLITGKRLLKLTLIVGLILVVIELSLQKLPLAAIGLILDILAVVLISVGVIDDYLDELHANSLAPDGIDDEHIDRTRYDLIRMIDESFAVFLLVFGFSLQIPSTF